MGLFDFIKRLFGRTDYPQSTMRVPPIVRPAADPRQSQPAPRPPTPRRQPLLLDAGQFAPIADDEARRRAGELGSAWSNPWFGRRDLIPPPDDPRTRLIDQAMVGQGFATAEELVRIHDVGLEMDKVRPDYQLARHIAQQAVQQTEDERRALRARKKAEAAERMRLRQEAITRRRATDIVFLGRGVSRGLSDRRANVEKLSAAGHPVLASPADVASALGLSIPRLRWLAFHSEAAAQVHYVYFSVPKRSGGTRMLSAPHRDLAAAQTWILDNVLRPVPVHPAAHGFVAGRSTLTNARPHVGRRVVVNADLRDFFPTITFPRVRGIFEQMGYSPAAATILALLCTESPRRKVEYAGRPFYVAAGPRALPQGACTSPALSNLAARRMDARLTGISARLGWTYTRYADDLTFSAAGPDSMKQIGYLLARVRHIAGDEGFAVNEAKTRVQRASTAQTVTGIVVNERPGIPRRDMRRLRAILHNARKNGLAAANRRSQPGFDAWLRGMVAYVSMVNETQGSALRTELNAIDARRA